ncbi:MAG: hypothetical protein FWC40_02990 [Proteobacteria bacterium]|nr:hypothetical protein [Pseudomonadota bacterium]
MKSLHISIIMTVLLALGTAGCDDKASPAKPPCDAAADVAHCDGGTYRECIGDAWKTTVCSTSGRVCLDAKGCVACVDNETPTCTPSGNYAKCEDNAWIILDDCLSKGMACSNQGCETCQEGEVKCTADGRLSTCTDATLIITNCPLGEMCSAESHQCIAITGAECSGNQKKCGDDGKLFECVQQQWHEIDDCASKEQTCSSVFYRCDACEAGTAVCDDRGMLTLCVDGQHQYRYCTGATPICSVEDKACLPDPEPPAECTPKTEHLDCKEGQFCHNDGKCAYFSTLLNYDDVIRDMFVDNEGTPHGTYWMRGDEELFFGWALRGRVEHGIHMPSTWTNVLAWGQLYADRHLPNPNTDFPNIRVHIKDLEIYILHKNGEWKLLDRQTEVDGKAYVENFKDDINKKADDCVEADGGISVTAGTGFNYHYWGKGASIAPDDIKGLLILCKARLIGANAGENPKYLLSVGADFWRGDGSGWDGYEVNNMGVGIGRSKYVTDQWQYFSFHTFRDKTDNERWITDFYTNEQVRDKKTFGKNCTCPFCKAHFDACPDHEAIRDSEEIVTRGIRVYTSVEETKRLIAFPNPDDFLPPNSQIQSKNYCK